MQNTDNSLKRKYNFLFYYTIISSSLFFVFILSSFIAKENKITADEITVKRVTVVGEDGTSPRVVISNETRQHSGRMDGKDVEPRKRDAGIIFFNNEGDEVGGLSFGVEKDKNTTDHAVYMTMDNHKNDQVIFLRNIENYENGKATIDRGLEIREYPADAAPLMKFIEKIKQLDSIKDPKAREAGYAEYLEKNGARERLFIGRDANNDNGLFLYDAKGNPKMKLYVDNNGNPKIVVIDSTGKAKNIIQ
ncbi:hypothetical protein [Chitinophaga sp. Cy-1792]|uniref:hypothetical protein n=1 Tax=Chitinophaga sp. Cy-1792 TaxID=2608339 RepID=UPI00141FC400|nr:hypothetical protein [Chitinophaga sp. Cy-1792]NIG53972.1 hypothetical protein [Chitinophaga sp. Cy-1792]